MKQQQKQARSGLCASRVGIVIAFLTMGCMGQWPGDRPPLTSPKVGFIYVGPTGDYGWTYAQEEGRRFLNQHLAGAVSHYQPSVSPADLASVVDQFVAGGDNVIITTSADYLVGTMAAAGLYPRVNFMNCTILSNTGEMGTYFGRMYQSLYLAGMIAGEMSRNKRIGIVGPVVAAEAIQHINAFTLGAREVGGPETVVDVEWINAYFDPDLEPVVTRSLVGHGADVILTLTDTTIALETVDSEFQGGEHPVYSMGHDSRNMCDNYPNTCVASSYWNWGPLFVQLVQQMMAGEWDPAVPVWEQMKGTEEESVVNLAITQTPGLVAPDLQVKVGLKLGEMVASSGVHKPFIGPIHDVDNTLRVAEGQEITDEGLARMCWYVEGVVQAEVQDDGSVVDIPGRVPNGCVGDP